MQDVRKLPELRVDDLPRAVCRQMGKDVVLFTGWWRGLHFAQRVTRESAKPDLPWFCWNIKWKVGRPYVIG